MKHRWFTTFISVSFVLGACTLAASLISEEARTAGELGWSYAFVLVWRDFQNWLTHIDWRVVFGAVLIMGTVYILWKLSTGKGPFSFADAFAGENGKTSMSKLGMWIAIMVTSWVVVSKTVDQDLSDTLFSAYLFALVLGKVGSEAVGVLRQSQVARTVEAQNDSPSPDEPPPRPEPAVTTTTVTAVGRGAPRPRGKYGPT